LLSWLLPWLLTGLLGRPLAWLLPRLLAGPVLLSGLAASALITLGKGD
jgi:hypothetical protein